MQRELYDVVVVGAGIVGCSVSYHLAKSGLKVALVDKGSVAKLTPDLNRSRFVRAWAGLRPGSADGLPLIWPSHSVQGLWIAGGHFRDGILLGPLTGHILAELIQKHSTPFGLDLQAFNPDRFGGWDSASSLT